MALALALTPLQDGTGRLTVPVPEVGYAHGMSAADQARAYVKGWAETGRLLEQQRWAELAALSDEAAIAAADALIIAALEVPLPEHRRIWSGLVEQQAAFHRRP